MKILENKGITAPQGFEAAGVACGIKASGKKDLALIRSVTPAETAAAFTANKVAAAPVLFCRELLKHGARTEAIVINSGNANACTGEQGRLDAAEMSRLTSQALAVDSAALVASTGIIGEKLPMAAVGRGIAAAAALLSPGGGGDAAAAITTTDAFTKEAAVEIEIDGKIVRVGGMAKGAGMIAPRLIPHATMIAVIATDAAVAASWLSDCLASSVDRSFNRATVDGDTSTNDTVFLLANGMAGNKPVAAGSKAAADLQAAVEWVMMQLAKSIVRDGEGATKLITYRITGAIDEEDAAKVGMAVANSLLVKTAFFGMDPNWGRILAAAGRTASALDPSKINLFFGDIEVVRAGGGIDFNADEMAAVLAGPEITVSLDLGVGKAEVNCFGCDLSYDYVKINAEYHT